MLVGDAAHTMHPVLGTGLNSALEDAFVLTLYLTGRVTGDTRVQHGMNSRWSFLSAAKKTPRTLNAMELVKAAAAFSAVRGPEVRAVVTVNHVRGKMR